MGIKERILWEKLKEIEIIIIIIIIIITHKQKIPDESHVFLQDIKMDLALNNLQGLIYHKTQANKERNKQTHWNKEDKAIQGEFIPSEVISSR